MGSRTPGVVRSRTLEHTCPSCHPDPFTVERRDLPRTYYLGRHGRCPHVRATSLAAIAGQRRPGRSAGRRSLGPVTRAGAGRASTPTRSGRPGRCSATPGQTSDGVPGEIAAPGPPGARARSHGDQRRHLRDRPRHEIREWDQSTRAARSAPTCSPSTSTPPTSPSTTSAARTPYAARPSARLGARGPGASAASTATSSTSPTPARRSASAATGSAASCTAPDAAGSRRTLSFYLDASRPPTSARWPPRRKLRAAPALAGQRRQRPDRRRQHHRPLHRPTGAGPRATRSPTATRTVRRWSSSTAGSCPNTKTLSKGRKVKGQVLVGRGSARQAAQAAQGRRARRPSSQGQARRHDGRLRRPVAPASTACETVINDRLMHPRTAVGIDTTATGCSSWSSTAGRASAGATRWSSWPT